MKMFRAFISCVVFVSVLVLGFVLPNLFDVKADVGNPGGSDFGTATINCNADTEQWSLFDVAMGKVNLVKLATAQVQIMATNIPVYILSGASINGAMACVANSVSQVGIIPGKGCTTENSSQCINLTTSYDPKYAGRGGMMGLAGALAYTIEHDPVPVNLAYFYNRTVSKIPFMGSAMAQTTSVSRYSGPLLGVIYLFWKVFRDIALGFMAIVMMITGIMLITRKKISPQVSLTIQIALPRIILALILIVFSYPIGAAGASLSSNLRANFANVIGKIDYSDLKGDVSPEVMKLVRSVAFWNIPIYLTLLINGLGASFMALMVLGVMMACMGIFSIIAFVKVIFVYIKILFSIITAPLTFSMGAIPGFEKMTADWFKTFAARIISIPAMWGVLDIGGMISFNLLIQSVLTNVAPASFGFGSLGMIIAPLVYLFACLFALKVPNEIEKAFGIGAPAKSRK